MANGAIADTQILCSTYDESFDSFCKPCQNARSRVDNNGGSWWCIPSTVTEPWFQVSFSEPVIVLKVLIESHSSDHFPRSIKFFSTTEDPINENFIPFYHDTASDQDSWPLTKELVVVSLNEIRPLQYFRLVIAELSTSTYTTLRFEFFGCAYWEYGRPLGMSNKFIKDEHLSSFSIETREQNPLNSRLNMAGRGWFPNTYSRPQLSGVAGTNVFLQIKFPYEQKVLYIVVTNEMEGGNTLLSNSYGMKYGKDESNLFWYQNKDGSRMIIFPPKYDNPNVKLHHVFWYPLVGKVFQYVPFCGINNQYGGCNTVQLELYGVSKQTADHEWKLQDLSSTYDDVGYRDLKRSSNRFAVQFGKTILSYETSFQAFAPMTSFGFPLDDCIVSPENCHDGLSVAFWAKFSKKVNYKKTIFEVDPALMFQLNGACSSAANVPFNMNLSAVMHIKNFDVARYSRLEGCTIYIGKSIMTSVTVFVYINMPEAFVSSCQYETTHIQPIVTFTATVDYNRFIIIPDQAINVIVNSPVWSYGMSLSFVIKAPPYITNKEREKGTEGKLTIHEFLACDSFRDGIVSNLPPESFTQKDNCTTFCASDARFGQVGWINNLEDDYLVIDLLQSYEITMLKVAASKKDIRQNYFCSFSLFYMNGDQKNFQAVKNTFVRTKGSQNATEHLALPHTVVAHTIKILMKQNCEVKTGLRVDIVTCERFPVSLEDSWLKLNSVPICFGGSSGVFSMRTFYQITAFRLVHKSGQIKCAQSVPYSNFGCKSDPHKITTYITTENNTILAPLLPFNNEFSTDSYAFTLTGYSKNSPEIIMQSKPTYFQENEDIHIWNSEDLYSSGNSDNDGQVCVDVLGWGKKTPGIYIVEKCSSTPVCPCLSIISEELKFHESCKDMFYFTTRGYLVHVNTGHCLTWSVDKFVLNQFCTESFSVHINGIIKHQNNNCLYPEGGVGPPIHDKSVNLISDSASCSKFNFAYDVPRPEAAYNIEFAKQKYHFATESMKFADAASYCQKLGYNLPVFHNKLETLVMKSLIRSVDELQVSHNSIWLGIRDFVTLDGSPYDYLNTVSQTSGCWSANYDGIVDVKNCDTSGPIGVVCEVPKRAYPEFAFISSGLHKTQYATIGKGFQFSISYGQKLKLIASLQTNKKSYMGYIEADYDVWNLFTLTWNVRSKEMMLYKDTTLVTTVAALTDAIKNYASDVPFETNFLCIGSPYYRYFVSYYYLKMHGLKIWKHSLSTHDIKEVFFNATITFSELHDQHVENKDWKLFTGCSDHDKMTGPCYDVSTHLHYKDVKDTYDCDWLPGNGVGGTKALFPNIVKRSDCARTCKHQFELDGTVNGATYKKDTKECYCFVDMESISTTAVDKETYDSCFPPVTYKFGKVSTGVCCKIEKHPVNKWWYCRGSNGVLYSKPPRSLSAWKHVTSQTSGLKAIKFDSNGSIWTLRTDGDVHFHGDGTPVKHDENCNQFAVTATHIFCVKSNTLSGKVKIASENMKILAHDINIICASDDSDAVFAHSTTDDTIKKVPINDSILNITSPLPSNCLKALEAFETQIVISTCDGIWLWRQFGEWQNITSESSLDHAFVDENHILFVKSDDESIFHTRLQQTYSSKYQLSPLQRNFDDARKECQVMQADLVSNIERGMLNPLMRLTYPNPLFTYVGLSSVDGNNFVWFNGSSATFGWYSVEPNGASEMCGGINCKRSLVDVNCSSLLQYMCDVPETLLLATSTPVHSTIYHAPGVCLYDSNSSAFPRVQADKSSVGIFQFQLNITQHSVIRNAFLKFLPIVNNDDHYALKVDLNQNSKFSSLTCVPFSNKNDYELVEPLYRNVSNFEQGVSYHVDVTAHIEFVTQKSTWREGGYVTFHIEMETNDGVVRNARINARETQLVVYYETRDFNPYIFFPSKYSPVISPMIYYSPIFRPNMKALSFWIYMFGPDVGTLFVWQHQTILNKLICRFKGSQGNYWRQVWISIEGLGEFFQIIFTTFNNLGSKGHIAIDHIQGFVNNASVQINNEYTPKFDTIDTVAYKERLKTLNFSQPIILYPFNSFKDFGLLGLDLTAEHIYTDFLSDKYFFLRHSIYSKIGDNKAIIKSPDFTDTYNFKRRFSILLHLVAENKMHSERTIFKLGAKGSQNNLKFSLVGNLLKISVISNGIKLEHFGATEIIINSPVYVGLIYGDGFMKLYSNNELDLLFPVPREAFDPFPSPIFFTRDDADVGKSPKETQFHGSLSCFQMHNKSLSKQEIIKLEFCPNRQEEYYHTNLSTCMDGGISIPFSRGCICPENNKRYMYPSCGGALQFSSYKNSISYASFDNQDQNIGEKESFSLTTGASSVASPINNGICVANETFLVGSLTHGCVSAMTGCQNGYTLGMWLLISMQTTESEYTEINIVQFNIVKVNVMRQSNYSMALHVVIKNCRNSVENIGIRNWNYFLIKFSSNWQEITLYVNGKEENTISCSTPGNMEVESKLYLRGTSKVCIDEFSVTPNQDGVDLNQLLYHDILRGAIESEQEILRKYVEIRVLVEPTNIPNDEAYKAAYTDITTSEANFLQRRVIEMLNDTFSKLSDNYVGAEIQEFQSSGKTTPSLFFSYFGLENEAYFSEEALREVTFFYPFKIHTNTWMPVVGVPTEVDFEVLSPSPNNTFIKIKNRLPKQESNHLGYRIKLKKLKYLSENETEEVLTYFTGEYELYLNVSTYRRYEITLWPLTHWGYGKRSVSTFLSSPDKNKVAPYNITGVAWNESSIKVDWEFAISHWTGPSLLFYVFWKEVTDDFADYTTYQNSTVFNQSVIFTNDRYFYIESPDINGLFSFFITGLKPFTNYSVVLQTYNPIGFGKASDVFFFRSGEWYPELAPTIKNLSLIAAKLINITWIPIYDIEQFNSWNITGYLISILPIYPRTSFTATNHSISSNETSFQIELEAFEFYKVKINIFNHIGNGPDVERCFATGEEVPKMAPDVLNAINITASSVILEIGGIKNTSKEDGVITHYVVRFDAENWVDEVKERFTPPLNHSLSNLTYWEMMKNFSMNCSLITSPQPSSAALVNYTIGDLHSFVYYKFRVSACTRVNCSSEHEKTISVRTLPSLPTCFPNFTSFENTSSTSLVLKWENLFDVCVKGILQNFYVVFLETSFYIHATQNKTLDEVDLSPSSILITPSNSFEYKHLKKYWNYSAVIYISNQVGKGPYSSSIWAMTAEDTPDGPPSNVTATVLNSTAVLLTIQLPHPDRVNGIITGYNIIDELSRANEHTAWRFNETITYYVVNGLLPFTEYKFAVSAFTKIGAGPSSFPVDVLTDEEAPSLPPANFTATPKSSSSVTVTWQHVPTAHKHGIIHYFLLYGNGTLANKTDHKLKVQNISHYKITDTFEFTQEGLFPATVYSFFVQACNNPGCSVLTAVNASTLEMTPSGSVTNCTQTVIDEKNKLSIEWTNIAPMQQRGEIITYKISYTRMNHAWETFAASTSRFITVDGSTHSLVIEKLDNYTNYEVEISGLTKVGEGPKSQKYVFRTPENVPSKAPTGLYANNISSSGINIQFNKIDVSFHEGKLKGYKILYQEVDLLEQCFNRSGKSENCYNVTNVLPSNDVESVNITDLGLNVNYSVCVRGYTAVGDGVLSPCVYVETGMYVDGNWTSWSEWGVCDQSCGNGTEKRHRWCMEPFPKYGGADCPGPDVDLRPCNDFTCPGFYLAQPNVDCDETCSSVNTSLRCVDRILTKNSVNIYKTAMEVLDYTSETNITCDISASSMNYSKDIDPVYDLQSNRCEGYANVPDKIQCSALNQLSPHKRRLCSCLDSDSINTLPWALWGTCSVTCGGGVKKRYRTCLLESGKCNNTMQETDCNVQICQIDGMWGTWGNFSDCDKSCGHGKRIRTRSCDSPSPRYGGKECAGGISVDYINGCNPYPCPINGKWSNWYDFEECTQPCGLGGVMLKRRYCDNPAPLYNGAPCPGDRIKMIKCNENIACAESKVTFVVKLLDENWQYRLVYSHSQRHMNLSRRLTDAIREVSKPDVVTYQVLVNAFWKGSVNANFSLYLFPIPSLELIKIQHAIDYVGMINSMPVKPISVTSDYVPFDPPSFSAVSNTPLTIHVSWTKIPESNLNGDFTAYYIHYRVVSEHPPAWQIMGSNNLSVVLRDLRPATTYGLRLAAATPAGRGIATEELQLNTKEAAPWIKPPNYMHQALDANTVYLSWDDIPQTQIPGVLLGYRITYRPYYSDIPVVVTNAASMLLRTLRHLRPFTLYWVEICGYTIAGCGPSDLIIFKTPASAPGVIPPEVTVYDRYTTDTVLLTWKAIPEEKENSNMLGYRITYELLQTADVDVVEGSENIHTVSVDKFTFDYTLTGLKAYSLYVINVFGYSDVGSGPSKTIYARTCKCPKDIFTNYFQLQLYMGVHTITDVISGIFPTFISGIIKKVCTECRTYRYPTIHFNRTYTGHNPSKLNEIAVRVAISEVTHMSFPIYGKFDVPNFMGNYPYLGVALSQGSAMVVYYEEVKVVEFTALLMKILSSWPIVVIGVLCSCVVGIIYWFTEQGSTESDIQLHSPVCGFLGGVWMAVITMTTVGYGDIVPSTNLSKAMVLVWVLAGLIIVNIFLSVATSSMVVNNQQEDIKLYGEKTAAIFLSREYNLAVMRNAMVNDAYENTLQVLSAVADKKVKVGLIDAVTAGSYIDRITNMSLKIHKVIDSNTGYGLVLSGGLEVISGDFESYLTAEKPQIQVLVDEIVGRIVPPTPKTDVELLSKSFFISCIIMACKMFVGLAVMGIIVSIVRKIRKRKVHPEARPETSVDIYKRMHVLVQNFKDAFVENVKKADARNNTELILLADLRSRYTRLLKRCGYSENDIALKMKRKAKKHKKRRKRIINETEA